MAQQEIELKLILDQPGYMDVQELYPVVISKKAQSNHYYDTSDLFFHQQGCTLRWREEGEAGYMTVKIRGEIGSSGISQAVEWETLMGAVSINPQNPREVALLVQTWEDLPETWQRELPRIQYLGAMRNQRLELQGDAGLVYELDRTEYPSGDLGYELEVEGVSEADAEKIRQKLKKSGIAFELPLEGKRTRFLRDTGFLKP